MGGRSLNQGSLNIYLKPRSQRPQVEQVIQELRPKLEAVPGMTVFLRNDPPIRIGGIQSKALYQFTMQAANTKDLFGASQDFLAKMQKLPGLQDVTSDLQIKNPQINVIIDRDKSSALGVTANQIEDALYSAYGFRQVSTIFAPNNQYRVILELEPQYQRDVNASLFAVPALEGRATRTLERRCETHEHVWAAFGEPPRTASRGNTVL